MLLLNNMCSCSTLVSSPITETQVSAIRSNLPSWISTTVKARIVPWDSGVEGGASLFVMIVLLVPCSLIKFLTRGTMAPFRYMVLSSPTTIIFLWPFPCASSLCMWPNITSGMENWVVSFKWEMACAKSVPQDALVNIKGHIYLLHLIRDICTAQWSIWLSPFLIGHLTFIRSAITVYHKAPWDYNVIQWKAEAIDSLGQNFLSENCIYSGLIWH